MNRFRPRRALVLTALTLTVLLSWTDAAKAGQYVVVQCHPAYSGWDSPADACRRGSPDYTHLKSFNSCYSNRA